MTHPKQQEYNQRWREKQSAKYLRCKNTLYCKKWRENNQEEVKKRQAAYYRKHRGEISKQQKEYHSKQRDEERT